MKAIETTGTGTTAHFTSSRPVPTLRPGYILVRNVAVALNPADWKAVQQGRAGSGALIGLDYAGVVEEVGPEVTKDWNAGDRVAGFVHGGNLTNKDDGSHAEYVVAKADIAYRIPETLSFDGASTLGTGVLTCGQAMFQYMELVKPLDPVGAHGEPIMIYGGSTATGSLAIQYAKLAGYTVITTCSPPNFDFVKALGADHVFDYRSPSCTEDIQKAADAKLYLVFDTIGSKDAAQMAADVLAKRTSNDMKPRYASINANGLPRDDVAATATVAYTCIGEYFKRANGDEYPPKPHDFEWAKEWASLTEGLLASGKLRTHPIEVRKDGLAGILDGLAELQSWKVSSRKLVYRIAETP